MRDRAKYRAGNESRVILHLAFPEYDFPLKITRYGRLSDGEDATRKSRRRVRRVAEDHDVVASYEAEHLSRRRRRDDKLSWRVADLGWPGDQTSRES